MPLREQAVLRRRPAGGAFGSGTGRDVRLPRSGEWSLRRRVLRLASGRSGTPIDARILRAAFLEVRAPNGLVLGRPSGPPEWCFDGGVLPPP